MSPLVRADAVSCIPRASQGMTALSVRPVPRAGRPTKSDHRGPTRLRLPMVVSSSFFGHMRDAGLLQLRLPPFRTIEGRRPQDHRGAHRVHSGYGSREAEQQWHRAL